MAAQDTDHQPDSVLNIRHFPQRLRWKLRQEASQRHTSLRDHLIWLLNRRNFIYRAVGEPVEVEKD